jgi:hypothetical protein
MTARAFSEFIPVAWNKRPKGLEVEITVHFPLKVQALELSKP